MTRIRHIALITKEPAKVAEFYKQTFGLTELRRSPIDAVFLSDGHINLAILRSIHIPSKACVSAVPPRVTLSV
jgi:catechol 2,3-dioxygenase-like lactoylglutathione lyase family enzyme